MLLIPPAFGSVGSLPVCPFSETRKKDCYYLCCCVSLSDCVVVSGDLAQRLSSHVMAVRRVA